MGKTTKLLNMTLLNKKLWDKYELQFPIDQKISFVIGQNGTGKTHLLNHLHDYFTEKGKNVLFFEEERLFLHDPEEAYNLIRKHTSLRAIFGMQNDRDGFVSKHDIDFNELMLEREYGRFIHRGKIQLVNFFCTIMKQTEETIVIIDEPERNLHLESQDTLVKDLLALPNVIQVIVATHAPSIISEYDACVEIHDCIMK